MKGILPLLFSCLPLLTYAQMQMDSASHQNGAGHMPSLFSRHLQMNSDGSGTSWVPEETPVHGYMIMAGHWHLMIHGDIFLRYTSQNINHEYGRGSADQIDAPNMMMVMAGHRLGKKGYFGLQTMFSLDPLTVGEKGYPLLLQTGESFHNQPLIDIQHPHDLIAALTVNYAYSISKNADVYAYFGYPGEPALGPSNFMHRFSAFNLPDAPIAHHWQDATHITFGVATLGYRYKKIKLEGSVFTGREPDANRYNFDQPRFDSYSARISLNPDKNFSYQVSAGYLKSPEAALPEENIVKVTASAMYVKNTRDNNYPAFTAVYGLNAVGDGLNGNSFLLEGNIQENKVSPYFRYEWVQKSGEELVLPENENKLFNLHEVTAGINYRFAEIFDTNISAGMQITGNILPAYLQTLYGNFPLSAEVYIKINPGNMMHNDSMHGMKM